MNPQDPENQVSDIDDDLGIFIISDSQCEEIESILQTVKYCVITIIVSVTVGLLLFFKLF
jgi:hypothetical protein